jgi:hypothetical protein
MCKYPKPVIDLAGTPVASMLKAYTQSKSLRASFEEQGKLNVEAGGHKPTPEKILRWETSVYMSGTKKRMTGCILIMVLVMTQPVLLPCPTFLLTPPKLWQKCPNNEADRYRTRWRGYENRRSGCMP